MDQSNQLELWTVCRYPTDHPNHFTARKALIDKGHTIMTDEVVLADTLEEIRNTMRMRGLVWTPSDDTDDPVIVEVWL